MYQNLVDFTRNGDFTRRVSTVKNYWELLTGDDGGDLEMSISV